MRINLKKIALPIAFVAALAVAWTVNYHEIRRPYTLTEASNHHKIGEMFYFSPDQAEAQVQGSITGTGTWGYMIPVYNTVADSTIFAGELVMWDTTATIKKGGVRRYLGVLSDRKRVCGIAATNIQQAQTGNGRGTIITWGYASVIKSSTSGGIIIGSPFRISAVNGAVVNAGDSLSMQVGYCTGGTAGVFGTNGWSRVKGYVNFMGGHQVIGSL